MVEIGDIDIGNTLNGSSVDTEATKNITVTGTLNDDAWDNNTENDYWDADASGAVSTDDVRLTPVGDAVALSTTETTIASASITPTRNASLIVSFGTTPAEVSTGETVNITAYNDSTSLTPAYVYIADDVNYETWKTILFHSGTITGGTDTTVSINGTTNDSDVTVLGQKLIVTAIPA